MVDGDVRIEHDGEFLDVRRPTQLAFTWRCRFTGDRPTVVTVELSDEDGKTRLVLEHEGLNRMRASRTRAARAGSLDRLSAIATSQEGS